MIVDYRKLINRMYVKFKANGARLTHREKLMLIKLTEWEETASAGANDSNAL